MKTTRLSSKGQVIIPKPLRSAHHWDTGQELLVIDTGDGILLKPKAPFVETHINEVASCLQFKGKARTLKDMEAAIAKGIQEQHQ
ncbi:MAG: AbrB/MazE/SpoVT family DNA-binding domain-containing protein [Gammaproteobacteria bacterium]|nr:AbrB/MazE/SpoVT family DNA-binding domain-containing protein [Gammaproteobacteria bacterium]